MAGRFLHCLLDACDRRHRRDIIDNFLDITVIGKWGFLRHSRTWKACQFWFLFDWRGDCFGWCFDGWGLERNARRIWGHNIEDVNWCGPEMLACWSSSAVTFKWREEPLVLHASNKIKITEAICQCWWRTYDLPIALRLTRFPLADWLDCDGPLFRKRFSTRTLKMPCVNVASKVFTGQWLGQIMLWHYFY